MQPTDGTATMMAPSRQAAQLLGRPGDERGLITLEWLLIVGAIAGLAASSVLIVQRVVDDASEVPVDPLVRLLEADIAAAHIAAEAQSAFDESLSDPLLPPYVDQGFSAHCNPGVMGAFSDVVDSVAWTAPADPNGTRGDPDDDVPAKCVVVPMPNLGGS